MTTRISGILLLLLSALIPFAITAQEESLVQVRLLDPLDEPEYYCLDVSGWGDHLKLDDPLQAHTCKPDDGADQMFSIRDNRFHVGTTNRCLEVAGSGEILPGSAIIARDCSDNPLQALSWVTAGK